MRREYWSVIAGALLGALLGWFVLRNADWPILWQMAGDIRWGLAAVVLCTAAMTFAFRAWRLRVLMEPGQGTPLWPHYAAITISDFIDIAVPIRAGLPIRAYLLYRLLGTPMSRGLAASVIDRLLDLVMLTVIVSVTVLLLLPAMEGLSIPGALVGRENPVEVSSAALRWGVLALLGLAAAASLSIVMLWGLRHRMTPLFLWLSPNAFARWVRSFGDALTRFAGHLHFVRSPSQGAWLIVATLATWASGLASFSISFAAVGLEVPPYTPLLTLSMVMLGSAVIPNAPGLVGQYHLAIVLSILLVAPDTPLPSSIAAAICIHLIHMTIIVALGTTCLAATHLPLRGVWRAARIKLGREAPAAPSSAP